MSAGFVHEPHCNTACLPRAHYLSSGVGMPHLHRTDLAECAACQPAPSEPTPRDHAGKVSGGE